MCFLLDAAIPSIFFAGESTTFTMYPSDPNQSHTPMTAAIQRAESPRDADPESKPTKGVDKGAEVTEKDSIDRNDSIDGGSMKHTYDHTRRKLKPRHVQLIGIGGTIGTALYVQVGNNLRTSGPASLFLGFSIWSVAIPPSLFN